MKFNILLFITVLTFGLAGQEKLTAAEQHGSMYVEQALVHSILPENGRYTVPVIMIPGKNLSSYIFVTTPDGREGWAQMFAEDGFEVYIINDPDFDFMTGGFSVSPFTVPSEGAPPADPDSERGWQRDVWSRWGFGESEGNPYSDTRFPTDYFSNFESNYPYVSRAGRSYSDAVVALLDAIGPAILLAHSAGASTAVTAAKARPDLVKGFILVEPAGPPDADDFPALAGMSMFGVYGDYIDSRRQGGRKAATESAAVLFEENGGAGAVVSLPDDLAINGNTHLMMQDNNSGFIAQLIMDWLTDNVVTQSVPKISISYEGGSVMLTSPAHGTWETSTNLIEWMPIPGDVTNALVFSTDADHAFFRQLY